MSETNGNEGGAVVLTGSNIPRAQLAIIESGLKLQVKGMKFTGNRVVRAAQNLLTANGVKPKRTHKALLTQFQSLRAKLDPDYAERATAKAAPNN